MTISCLSTKTFLASERLLLNDLGSEGQVSVLEDVQRTRFLTLLEQAFSMTSIFILSSLKGAPFSIDCQEWIRKNHVAYLFCGAVMLFYMLPRLAVAVGCVYGAIGSEKLQKFSITWGFA